MVAANDIYGRDRAKHAAKKYNIVGGTEWGPVAYFIYSSFP